MLAYELAENTQQKKDIDTSKKALSTALRFVSKLKGYHIKLIDEQTTVSSKTQQYIDQLNKTQPTAPTEIAPYEVAHQRAVKKEKTMRKQVKLGYDLNQMPVEKQVPFLK